MRNKTENSCYRNVTAHDQAEVEFVHQPLRMGSTVSHSILSHGESRLLTPPHSCVSEAATFQRKNYQRVGFGLALCGTRKMRRTPMRMPAEQPALPESVAVRCVAARECPGASCLTRWGFGACRDYGAAPSRDNCRFLSALASILAATTLCLAISLRRSSTSAELSAGLAADSPTVRAISAFGPAPPPFSAPFAFSVWASAHLMSLTSNFSSSIPSPPPSLLINPSGLHPEGSKALCCFGRESFHECRCHVCVRRSQPVPSPSFLDFLHVIRSCFQTRLHCIQCFGREPEFCVCAR